MPLPLLDAPPTAQAVLAQLWSDAGLPAAALAAVRLPGDGPVLPSSFAVALAAQASLGAAALAAAELWHLRCPGPGRQQVTVPREGAVLESCGAFTLDGVAPELWDKLSGLYPCGEAVGSSGWVRIHANFPHHRDGALRLLGLPPGEHTGRAQVAQALRSWTAEGFEAAAADAGLVVAAVRSFAQWDAHPQGQAVATLPVVEISRIDDRSSPDVDAGAGAVALADTSHGPDARASATAPAQPLPWPVLAPHQPPLHGLRVLDLTRILAGPVAGRTLAAHGAEVLLVNSPSLPNIAAIAETSRGKRSCQLDLRTDAGQAALHRLVDGAHVFLQGYRPGGLAALGFGAQALARQRPGIVVASLSAYGRLGPWAGRRGFDSLVQTACGFNLAEAEAAGAAQPQALPLQILDYAAGYLLAFGIQAALWRQATQGGSWQVQVSLAGVAHWLRGLGRMPQGLAAARPDLAPLLHAEPSGFGTLRAMPHSVRCSHTPPGWRLPSMPPGSHPPAWTDG